MSATMNLRCDAGFSAALVGEEVRALHVVKTGRACPRSGARAGDWSRPALSADLSCVASGDVRAFERVYAGTSAKLFGVIVCIVGRREIAEEVLQDVYVRVWRRASQFDPSKGSPITWLATIARNLALDAVKRPTWRPVGECSEALEMPSGDDPFAELSRDDDRRRLSACLERLGSEKRAIVMMAYHYGMTRAEIAAETGRPVATVKTWLRRSLSELKELLGE
jgi:RNA polymerase sigma-70 factor, ECF subfamily